MPSRPPTMSASLGNSVSGGRASRARLDATLRILLRTASGQFLDRRRLRRACITRRSRSISENAARCLVEAVHRGDGQRSRAEGLTTIDRAASTNEVARRLTSHLHGAGRCFIEVVYVKDDVVSRRCEAAEVHEMAVVAAPEHILPVAGVFARSAAISGSATAIEGKRRCEHSSIADRRSVGSPAGIGRPQGLRAVPPPEERFQRACASRATPSRSSRRCRHPPSMRNARL